MSPHAPSRSRRSRAISALAGVLTAIALVGCGGDEGSGGGSGDGGTTRSGTPTYAEARKAQTKLDSGMIDVWNDANAVSAKPYACLRKSPRGGPELAKCVATCQACTVSMSRLEQRLRSRYKAAPAYVRSRYHAAYIAQVRNMQDHRSVLRAFAEYARVHGASSYQGMTEFDRAKRLVKDEDASAKVWKTRISRARERFGGYLSTLED